MPSKKGDLDVESDIIERSQKSSTGTQGVTDKTTLKKVSLYMTKKAIDLLFEVQNRFRTKDHPVYYSQIINYAVEFVTSEILDNPASEHLEKIKKMELPKRGNPGFGTEFKGRKKIVKHNE